MEAMMSENLKYWNALAQPPKEALKPIQAGRLKGKSDINSQWRIKAMTETFGPCGKGWKFEITNKDTRQCGQETAAFVDVNLYTKNGDEWSEPIPGTGGSMLYVQEKNGMHCNDEAFKMALTDALSVAMKQIGVAADVYMGLWTGSKYLISNTGGNGHNGKQTPPRLQQLIDAVAKNKDVLEQTDSGKKFKADVRALIGPKNELTEKGLADWLGAMDEHLKAAEVA